MTNRKDMIIREIEKSVKKYSLVLRDDWKILTFEEGTPILNGNIYVPISDFNENPEKEMNTNPEFAELKSYVYERLKDKEYDGYNSFGKVHRNVRKLSYGGYVLIIPIKDPERLQRGCLCFVSLNDDDAKLMAEIKDDFIRKANELKANKKQSRKRSSVQTKKVKMLELGQHRPSDKVFSYLNKKEILSFIIEGEFSNEEFMINKKAEISHLNSNSDLEAKREYILDLYKPFEMQKRVMPITTNMISAFISQFDIEVFYEIFKFTKTKIGKVKNISAYMRKAFVNTCKNKIKTRAEYILKRNMSFNELKKKAVTEKERAMIFAKENSKSICNNCNIAINDAKNKINTIVESGVEVVANITSNNSNNLAHCTLGGLNYNNGGYYKNSQYNKNNKSNHFNKKIPKTRYHNIETSYDKYSDDELEAILLQGQKNRGL